MLVDYIIMAKPDAHRERPCTIRMTDAVRERLDRIAVAEGRTFSNLVRCILEDWLLEEDRLNGGKGHENATLDRR
jgi:hypothetical protein